MQDNLVKLRAAYADVIRGYSIIQNPLGPVFIKHPNHLDSSATDIKTDFYFQKARQKNLPTADEKLADLKKEGMWSDAKDKRVRELGDYIKTLYSTKSKSLLRKEREAIQISIDDAEKEKKQLENEKVQLIGYTAEAYAQRKANEFFMYNSIYKEPSFRTPFFTYSEFIELDDEELRTLIVQYNSSQDEFTIKNIKKIAVSAFFLNNFCFCNDNPFYFYGKPVVELTFYQSELFSYGRYFLNIISEHGKKIPQHVLDNPEMLIDWYERNKNFEETFDKTRMKESGASTIVGADAEDIKDLGLQHNVIDLSAEATKKGGSLNFEDILKLHGH